MWRVHRLDQINAFKPANQLDSRSLTLRAAVKQIGRFKTVLRILLVLFLMFFASASSWGETMPFKVEIAIDGDSTNAEVDETQGVFFVNATVRNISSSDRKITVWTQHGWSWLPSSPDVSPDVDILQNVSSQITIPARHMWAG
jgi:hypothetical protein